MRTLSDLTYEPHRLIVAMALVALLAGVLAGRVVRRLEPIAWTTVVALIAGMGFFDWQHSVGAVGDLRLIGLAGLATATCWAAGACARSAGWRRLVPLVAAGPLLIAAAILWQRDRTPPLSERQATATFERRFRETDYRCSRSYNDGSVEIATLEFTCDPTRPPTACRLRACGPTYWIGLDDRGRIDDWMLSAP